MLAVVHCLQRSSQQQKPYTCHHVHQLAVCMCVCVRGGGDISDCRTLENNEQCEPLNSLNPSIPSQMRTQKEKCLNHLHKMQASVLYVLAWGSCCSCFPRLSPHPISSGSSWNTTAACKTVRGVIQTEREWPPETSSYLSISQQLKEQRNKRKTKETEKRNTVFYLIKP